MPRVYPPIWCQNEECKKCNFLECDKKVLDLFSPLRYSNLSFDRRSKVVEITSIAIYFGFCQRLAKFFLLFPQDSPIAVVRENFVNSTTELPATVSIQRILLDMLNHGDPEAPTDDVHKLRLMLIMKATKMKRGRIGDAQKEVEIKVSEKELDDFMRQVRRWEYDLFQDRLTCFEKTQDLNHCKYCFLDNCEQF